MARLATSLLSSFAAAVLMAAPTHATEDETPLQTLVPAGLSAQDLAGDAVAVVGDLAAIGAPQYLNGTESARGMVALYEWDGAAWVEVEQLLAPGGAEGDEFGASVDISTDGRHLAVGAPGHGIGGAVFVYRRSHGAWHLLQTVQPIVQAVADDFGEAVALDGERLVVGAPRYDFGSSFDRGAAYVFDTDASGLFVQQALLTASDSSPYAFYGEAVDVQGDTIVVGAWNHEGFASGFKTGNAYAIRHDGGAWVQEKKLWLGATGIGSRFGWDVAVHDTRIVVAAPHADVDSKSQQGKVFVFERGTGNWPLEQELVLPDGLPDGFFGSAVALQGDDLLVIGQNGYGGMLGFTPGAGRVHVFERSATTWTETRRLQPTAGESGAWLGQSLAVDAGLVLAGTPGADGNAGPNIGTAMTFDLWDDAWTWRGHGLPADGGTPVLTPLGPLVGGATVGVELAGAAPHEAVFLVAGASSVNLPVKSGVLVPSPDLLLTGFTTDANGAATIAGPWPNGLPAGLPLVLQAWIADAGAPALLSATVGASAETE